MRITGGVFRSRHLHAPAGAATRPTSDRVREALFSILASRRDGASLEGARVLDVYAGTGALGLEALSRGAAHATFVESSKAALAALRANVTALGVEDRARVLALEASRALERLRGGAFDLVLVDPPYARALEAARAVASAELAEGGVLVLEHGAKGDPPEIAGLSRTQTRTYGDTALSFYEP